MTLVFVIEPPISARYTVVVRRIWRGLDDVFGSPFFRFVLALSVFPVYAVIAFTGVEVDETADLVAQGVVVVSAVGAMFGISQVVKRWDRRREAEIQRELQQIRKNRSERLNKKLNYVVHPRTSAVDTQ